MSHSQSTANYNLPIFVNNDQPTWLSDVNAAMRSIDTGIHSVKTAGDTNTLAITNMQKTVTDHTTSISELSADVTKLGNEVKAIGPATASRAGLVKLTDTYNPSQDVSNQTAATGAAIHAAIKPLIVTNMLCIGDSFLDGYTPDGNVTPWGTLLAQKLGCTGTNVSKGGTGFAATVEGINFGTLVNNAPDASYDTVVFGGSINDRTQSKASVVSGLNTAIENVHNRWPNAKIYVFGYLWGCKGYGTNIENISAAMQHAISERTQGNVLYCKGCWTWNIGKTANISSDHIHPNSIGQQVIANSMLQFMHGGDPTVYSETVSVSGEGVTAVRMYDMIQVTAGGLHGTGQVATLDQNYSMGFTGVSGIATKNSSYTAGFFTLEKQKINIFGNSIDANGYFSAVVPMNVDI